MKSQIKNILPNFPEDIIEQWIIPLAITDGWPPIECNGILQGNWFYYFGPYPRFDYWRRIEWEMKDISLTFESLGRISQSQVTQIIEASISGANNALSKPASQ